MSAIDLIPILAPEFVGNPNLLGAIGIAETLIALDHCYRDQVVALMAAHYLTIAGLGGAASGQVVSQKEGQLSVTYATGGSGNSGSGRGLDKTSYGQEVDRLNRLCFGFTARTAWIE